jgi:hypothetical protein
LDATSTAVKEFSTDADVVYGGQIKVADEEEERLRKLKKRLGLEKLEDADMIRLIEKMHGQA